MDNREYILFIFIISSACSFLDIINISKKERKILFCINIVLAILVGIINFPTSADFEVYDGYYSIASGMFEFTFDNDLVDYGYMWIYTIVKSLNGTIYYAYAVTAFLGLSLIGISIEKYTKYIFLTWMFFLAKTYEMTTIIQIRQGLAFAIFIFTIRYIYRKNLKEYILLILAASLIHKTLLVAIVLYPICNKVKWSLKRIIIVNVVVLCLYFMPLTEKIFEVIVPYLGIEIPKYDAYIGTDYFMKIDIYSLLSRFFINIVAMVYLAMRDKCRFNNLYISMLILSNTCLCAFSDFATLAGRMSNIFSLALIFVPGIVMDGTYRLRTKLVLLTMLMLIISGFFIKNYMLNGSLYNAESTGI